MTGQEAAIVTTNITAGSVSAELISDGTYYNTSDGMFLSSVQISSSYYELRSAIRFQNVSVPRYAVITSATIQFVALEATSTPDGIASVNLLISIENNTAPAAFTFQTSDLSTRNWVILNSSWTPPSWTSGSAGAAQTTPDVSPIVQSIVSSVTWDFNGTIVMMLQSSLTAPVGTTQLDFRKASSITRPVLIITYAEPGLSQC
jgi:hypothetical protein